MPTADPGHLHAHRRRARFTRREGRKTVPDKAKIAAAKADAEIDAQVKYIVWRDGVVVPSRKLRGAGKGKGKRVAVLQPSKLPAGDPRKYEARRWRKRLTRKDRKLTVPDKAKIAAAKADAKIDAQVKYVVWRDGVVVPSQRDPRLRGKRAGITELKSPLPDADPGHVPRQGSEVRLTRF